MTSLLQQVRKARGWTTPELAQKLYEAASQLNIAIATTSSLRVMISRWENGRSKPDDRATLLLEHVFELPADALGLTQAESEETSRFAVIPTVRRSAVFSDVNYQYFADQLAMHVRADNASGALWVADTAMVQLKQLEQHAGTGSREVNLLAARYAEFLGWLLHDSGETLRGLKCTERAIDFAEVAGDTALAIYTLMRRSNILTYLSNAQIALAVAGIAARRAKDEAPHLLPVCLRQVALASAYSGNEHAFREAFDTAISLTQSTVDPTNKLASYCTTSYIEMEAALCWLALRRPGRAVSACERALARWPSALVRDEALCHARKATAYAELRDVDGACAAAWIALERVQSAPSARTLHMLRTAAKRLEPFRRNVAVKELNEVLVSVI